MRDACLVTGLFVSLLGGTAAAEPQIAVTTTVASPGQSISVTVSGGPGQFYAVIGSSVNSGASHAGVALGVGADVTMLAMGRLDGNGRAVVAVTPPFEGASLDRYYVQALTSTATTFIPLLAAPVGIVRNADIVVASTGPPGLQGLSGLAGPRGPAGPAGPQGPPGVARVVQRNAQAPIAGSSTTAITRFCLPGEHVIGGGGGSPSPAVYFYGSIPIVLGSMGWEMSFRNLDSSTQTVTTFALCATP